MNDDTLSGTGAILDVTASDFRLGRPGDTLELVSSGALAVIIRDTQIDDAFFDLSSGLAGEVVQKCVNYDLRVAVVMEQPRSLSASFEQFATESTRQGRFIFVSSVDEAYRRLA